MIPSITLSSYTTPPPVINTPVPGSSTLHVPVTTVAPSFSSPQVNNNARGNNTQVSTPDVVVEEQAAPASEPIVSGRALSQPSGQVANAQTTFLAQLAAQEDTPESQVILVQYEKLVAFSNVKFKPSNALKEEPAPSSVFGQFLHEEHATAPVQQTAAPAPAANTAPQAATPAPAAEIQAAESAPVQAKPAVNENTKKPEPKPVVSPGLAAYGASIARVYSQRPQNIVDLA